jgi:hypothetical protein
LAKDDLWPVICGYFGKARTAEHDELFDVHSELGNGSHSGDRLGCSDYNKLAISWV